MHVLQPDNLCEDSKEIYRVYRPKEEFEVVVVALGDNEKLFSEAFSFMPWLAIPHEDQEGRDLIGKKFCIDRFLSVIRIVRSLLIDPDGTVLVDDCKTSFRNDGPEGFPFSRRKKAEIKHADEAFLKELLSFKKLPLQKLLGNFVLSSDGKRIHTSDLKGHTLGLHFIDISHRGDESTQILIDAWTALQDDTNKKFAIVTINDRTFCLSNLREIYQDKYKDIPWYTLPVDGRKLSNVFRVSDYYGHNAGRFIILEPDRYQPFNYFALDVLEHYGIEAYPLTLERAVEIEKQNLHLFELSELLSPSAPLHTGCSDCIQVCMISYAGHYITINVR